MIKEYILLKCDSLQGVVQLVNEKIALGYQPFGSITFVPTYSDNSGKLYVQTMVKYD